MTFVPSMRPRFRVVIELSTEEAQRRLTAPLSEPDCPVQGVVAGFHMELKIPVEKRHFWSPNLSVELLDQEGETHLIGLFGPRPSVWTLFAAYYAALAFLAFMGGIFGLSQWFIDERAWALWSVPIAAAGAVAGYSSTLFGQRLARDEMEILREYLRHCFKGADVRASASKTPPRLPDVDAS